MSLIKKLNQYNAGIPTYLHDIKWAAMRESPFRFYRATDFLFAADFEKLYKAKPKVRSWGCGDAHFENFGSYKGNDRQVYFDINDFDEALLGPPELEIARFLTSISVAAGQMNVAYVKLHKALHDVVQAYCNAVHSRKAMLLQAPVAEGEFKKFFAEMSSIDRGDFIKQRTTKKDGALLIKTDGHRYMELPEQEKQFLFEQLSTLLKVHPYFSELVFEDAAIRISGTGSLGLSRYAALFFSRKKGKHYLLDIKASRPSCNAQLIANKQPKFKNEAERIITAGYIMQYAPPAFMVAHKMDGQWYVIKELQPTADKMSIESFGNDFGKLASVAQEMAKLIAYSQLRSSGHLGASSADELVKFAGKKQWQKDIIEVSGVLAKKNEGYYKTFCK